MEKPVRSLLVSEYFPQRPEQMVHGVFQRLHRHVEALSSIGPVDFVFLWPLHWTESEAERNAALAAFRKAWSIGGRIVFVAPPPLPRLMRWWPRRIGFSDLIAASRGAVSFFDGSPNMRSSRLAEATRLSAIIADWQPDLIFAHRLAASAALLRCGRPLPPVLVDMDDLEHIAIGRSIPTARRWWRQARRRASASFACRTERLVAQWATASLVCSAHDRLILRQLAPGARVELAPNTASVSEPSSIAAAPSVLFVGYCRYRPNAEGVMWFVRDVLPIVRKAVPAVRFVIAGDGGADLGVADAACAIEVFGFVPDLSPLYAAARVVVCPVKRGGGTRIKIIEAALHGRPVVSTTVGAEGLELVDGREFLIADDAASFAAAVIRLLREDDTASALGTAAAAAAREHYGAAKIRSDLAQLAASMAHAPQNSAV